MSKKLKRFSVLFFVLALLYFIPSDSRVLGAESEAISRVSLAEDSLEATYLSLLEAERTGGDVSELVELLNVAFNYYSEAEMALEAGEYETAILLAGKVVEVSNVVFAVDMSVKVVAEHFEDTDFRITFLLSLGSVCFIVLFGFVGWRRFKDYYTRRVMRLRLEVVANDA